MKSSIRLNYRGEWLNIEFKYTQGENQVMHNGDGSGYPGSRSSVKITEVLWNDIDLTWLLEDNERLKEMIIEEVEY
jgi:hypothetical protein